jgi:tetratricopeptide (TPR) repeat protein
MERWNWLVILGAIIYLLKSNSFNIKEKMIKRTIIMFVYLILFALPALSQSKQDYLKAEVLAMEANSQLLLGNLKTADSIINESINLYPTRAIFAYAKNLSLLLDVKNANAIMDKAYHRVETFPIPKILLNDINPRVIGGKVIRQEVREYDLPRALLNFGYEAYLINKENGDSKSLEKILEKVSILNIKNDPLKGTYGYDFEYHELQDYKWKLAVCKKDFDKAIDIIKHLPSSKIVSKEGFKISLAYVYFEKGDYESALNVAETIKGVWIKYQYKIKFMIYAVNGKSEEALKEYKMFKTSERGLTNTFQKTTNDEYYYLAVIDLQNKDYISALSNLDSALNFRSQKGSAPSNAAGYDLMDKWKVYKLIGDAYTGLQQYDKARDNYTISLLSNPEYEPAQKGLLQLGSQVVLTLETDKTAPAILITEPATNRGLEIVSAGNDILVKGTAADPSGLKSVTINGLVVYAQTDGNFWGNVPLKAGVNKIIVIATDGAGNASEHTFEIEKKSAIATSAIVPATTKEGKNYCLLIGAQNYEDLNIPSLENPIQDAVKLKIILKKDYDFEDGNIFNLFNPSANDVKRQLLELTNVILPEDNLLIFYAGHGIWVEKEKKGYWLLVDAQRNDSTTWLQNKDVLNLIAKLPSRHTLLITDACFSGGVFKTRSIGKNAPAALKTMDEKISRVAITSGNDTEVPDESVFMKYLVKALTENKEKYLTAQKMFINQIMEAVMTETKTEPRYGTLELAGHIGGDYIFAKK